MAPQTRARSRADVGALIARLPPDVLIRIFAALPREELQGSVQLVCRRWHTVATEPSSLFDWVSMDLTQQQAVPPQPSLEAWLRARAGFLQELDLVLAPQQAASAALVVAALGSASVPPQLDGLKVDFGGADSEAASGLLAALAATPLVSSKLEGLSIVGVQGELRHAHLGDSLQLPCLRLFGLIFLDENAMYEVVDDHNWLPEGFPAFLLACHELEDLVLHHAGWESLPVLPEGLGQLRHLQDLSVVCCGVEELPDSMTALTGLTNLHIYDEAAKPALRMPPSLAALSQLTDVCMSSHRVPVALGTLPALKRLKLRYLSEFDDKEAEYAQLLDGLRLEELTLSYCAQSALGEPPAAIMRQASLHRLKMNSCGLRALTPGPYLQQLKHLDLRFNFIRESPPAALAAPQLETLVMRD